MRFHFGNPTAVRTVVDSLPLYGGGEFESPTRSTIPLLGLRSQAVEDSAWSAARSRKSSRATDGRQILVQRHTTP